MNDIIPTINEGDEDRLFRTCDFSLPESSEIVAPTPEIRRISLELRDQYLRTLARSKQLRQEQAKSQSDASADSSDSAPTIGS
jgi:hypothetical protein